MVDEAEMIGKARRGHPRAIAGVDWHGGGRLRSGGRQHLGVKVRAKIVGGGLGGFATMPGCGMKPTIPNWKLFPFRSGSSRPRSVCSRFAQPDNYQKLRSERLSNQLEVSEFCCSPIFGHHGGAAKVHLLQSGFATIRCDSIEEISGNLGIGGHMYR